MEENDIMLPKSPEMEDMRTVEEKVLEEIRSQEDYKEEKFYYDEEFFNLIDYVIEWSEVLNKKIKMTYLYNEIGGGQGTTLKIIE
jgi:hypothetical protein